MPTARKKEEVPRWFVLAANLSLKLHLENSFLAFERVVRCGGLLRALPPEIASKHLDPQTQEMLLECQGFNDKNHYERTTPCDQDTLRKFVRGCAGRSAGMDWFNGPVQQAFQAYGFFDPAGIFVGDGSYLFVPDNPAYEGSVVMWFDEHNHPVEYEKLTAAGAQESPPGTLLQTGEPAAPARGLLRLCRAGGGAGQCPRVPGALSVGGAIRAAGGPGRDQTADPGSRASSTGKTSAAANSEWGIDVLLPMKKKMDIWEDAWALGQRCPWQTATPRAPGEQSPAEPSPGSDCSAGDSNGRKPWRPRRPRNRRPIRPRCWSARRFVRSKALPVGPNAPCPSTSCCCATLTPMATRTNGP